ncbi:MAG: fructosamine kinase family protein [Gammaproteobacteria bacterium]|nr:fructosamine kinase family protein [Gammaproteobacteria bacterium]
MSEDLAAAMAAALGHEVAAAPEAAVHGGSINDCLRWQTSQGPVFVKSTLLARRAMLDAEVDSLERLRQAGALRVPALLAIGSTDTEAFLVLEWLDLVEPDAASEERFGEALAWQHRIRGPDYGLERDNFIGATPQPNRPMDDWAAFWRERRLLYQLELAASSGHTGRLQDRGRRLLEMMDVFFASYRPAASLLHGDLWSGNRGALADGTPVVFDPAVYYGDREADIAMTCLFHGFGPRFYSAYAATWPLDQAAGTRRALYNLYHVLNHLNLFGGSYRKKAEGLIDRLLAAAGH